MAADKVNAMEPDEEAVTAEVGRPTEYQDDYPEKAKKFCRLGATDDEVADFFDVSVRTIYRWKLEHPEFCQALKIGKKKADSRVERALYHKAAGYSYTEQQAFKVKVGQYEEEVEVVDVEKHAAPDTTAAIFWLKNRRSQDWRDRKEHDVKLGFNEFLESLEGEDDKLL